MESHFYQVLSSKTTEELKSMVDKMSEDYTKEAVETALKILLERGEAVDDLLRSAQIKSCSKCKHRKMSDGMLLCWITNKMATFVGSCSKYEWDEMENVCFTCKYCKLDEMLCELTNTPISSIEDCDGFELDEEHIKALQSEKRIRNLDEFAERLIEKGSTKEVVVQDLIDSKLTVEEAENTYERAFKDYKSSKTMIGIVLIVYGALLTLCIGNISIDNKDIIKPVCVVVAGVGCILSTYLKKKK